MLLVRGLDCVDGTPQMRYDAGRAIGHRLQGMLALGRGALVEAKTHLERSMSLADADRDSSSTQIFGQNPLVHTQALLCQTLFCLGDVKAALRIGREALMAVDELRHPHSTAIALGYIGGNVFGYCGATQHLLRASRRMLALCDQHDLPGFRPHALGFLGWGLTQAGELAEGVAMMESAAKGFDAMEYTLGVGAHLANLADALRRLGRLDDAKAVSARAIDIVRNCGVSVWSEPEILRVDALIKRDLGQDSRKGAADRLWRAAEDARRMGSPVFERRCLVSLIEVGRDPEIERKAHERLGALHHLDRLPALVESIIADAHAPA